MNYVNYIIKNAKIITPFEEKLDDILVVDGKIKKIGNIHELPGVVRIIDAEGMYLTPGFVDVHVHGGNYASATDGVENVIKMVNAHALMGTTTIVPTLFSVPMPLTISGAQGIVEAMSSGKVLSTIAGIHFEGPFLAPAQSGAQATDALIAPATTDLSQFEPFLPYTKMFGMAPELPGAIEYGRYLADKGVVVSIAHSDANYTLVQKAVENGFSDVTHLYSACSTVHRENAFRISGVVEAGLEMDSLTCQAIADGCHLPDSLIRLIYKCKGPEKMYLVTDGLEVSASDIKEGEEFVQSNGVKIICEDRVMKVLSRKVFAGSIATCDRLVRTAKNAGIPLKDCIRMVTDTPARRINAVNKGRIQEGWDADIVLMDKNLEVKLVMANGNVINEIK